MILSIPANWLLFPILALILYRGCLDGPFVFDDFLIGESTKDWKWNWKQLHSRHRLLTLITYRLQIQWPNTTRALHVGNILIHAANALAVAEIARALGYSDLAGLVYLLHPFAVNTVAYMTGRPALLSNLFGLLAVLAILAEHPYYIVPLLAAAVLSKEDAIGFVPLALILLGIRGEWIVLLLLLSVGLMAILGTNYTWRKWLKGNGDHMMAKIGLPVAYPQPLHGITALVETVGRIPFWLLGLRLSPYYGSGIRLTARSYRDFASGCFLLGLIGYFAPMLPLLILFGPWLVYLLCPVPDQLFDYRNYSMVLGFALLSVVWLPFAFVLLPYYIYRTVKGARAFASPISFWEAAVIQGVGDLSRAHQDLGTHHKMAGRNEIAEVELRKALALNPKLAPAMTNLASLLKLTQRDAEAVSILRSCTEECPEYPDGWELLGLALEQDGNFAAAASCYRRALALDPKLIRSINHLGLLELRAGRAPLAIPWFDMALAMQPGIADYQFNRAVCDHLMGNEAKFRSVVVNIGNAEQHVWQNPQGQVFPITPEMIPIKLGANGKC